VGDAVVCSEIVAPTTGFSGGLRFEARPGMLPVSERVDVQQLAEKVKHSLVMMTEMPEGLAAFTALLARLDALEEVAEAAKYATFIHDENGTKHQRDDALDDLGEALARLLGGEA